MRNLCGDFMATKDEEVNKQLKQFEKLTPEQIVKGLRFWLGHENDEPIPGQSKTPFVSDAKK